MNRTTKISLIALICAGIGLGSLRVGYRASTKKFDPSTVENRAIAGTVKNSGADSSGAADFPDKEIDQPPASFADPEKIKAATKMIYQYYYEADGTTEVTEEVAPYFLLDMTEESLRALFPEWELLSFASDRVVMQKTLSGQSSQHYILGIQNGYMAVFYTEPINGTNLKEITNTPVSTLSDEEQRKLQEGIPVDGDDRLMKLLEDYGS